MKLRLLAPAKVNLELEIVGRRADGWHEIVSVVQAIGLCDVLEAEPARELRLNAPPDLGPPEENLVLRAALLLREAAGVSTGASLTLKKSVPHGVGLGGGSSDAAAALRLLRRLWGVRRSTVALSRLAAVLGSDVPYFLEGRAALIRGRGEIVEPLPPLRTGYFVLVIPSWRVAEKTRRVYEAVGQTEYSSGDAARALGSTLEVGGPLDHGVLSNSLSGPARRVFPELAQFQERLEAQTGALFVLSGAGPALFHLAASRHEASRCARLARQLGAVVYVARPLIRRNSVRTVGF